MKTNNMSFARVLTRTSLMKYVLLHGVVLCAVLGMALSGMAQAQGSGQTAAKSAEQAASTGSGQALPVVEVYKSAQCGCCKAWAEHLQKNGFTVTLHDAEDRQAG